MIYLYLFGTCFHFIYVFMIIGKEVKSGHDIMIVGNPFPNGAKLYMWTRGTGEENCGIMTVQL